MKSIVKMGIRLRLHGSKLQCGAFVIQVINSAKNGCLCECATDCVSEAISEQIPPHLSDPSNLKILVLSEIS